MMFTLLLFAFQILIKEYNFDSRHKPAFTEEDILNIFPVVKHVNPKASDAFHFFQSGQAKVQQGETRYEYNHTDLITETVPNCWSYLKCQLLQQANIRFSFSIKLTSVLASPTG